jgi:predicted ATPase
MRYRLLETTRVYAGEKLEESGEKRAVAQRHARHFASILNVGDAAAMGEHLGNMRASLEWVFGSAHESADIRLLAVDLAAGSAPVFLELSLLTECHKWSLAGLALLDDRTRGTRQELALQESFAVSATWALASPDEARDALTRAIDLAQHLGDTPRRLRLLVGLHIFLMRGGEIRASLAVAEEFAARARAEADASYAAVAECLLGGSHHFLGDQRLARAHMEKGLASHSLVDLHLSGLDTRLRGLVVLARVMWLTGFPDRAIALAREALALAEKSNRPLSLCFSFIYTAPVFLWCGDHRGARLVLDKLMVHPNWHALPSLHATGYALQGALQIREGEVARGIELVRSAVRSLRADRQNLFLAAAVSTLARRLAAIGQFQEALSIIEDALTEAREGTEMSNFPELLRIHAEILLDLPQWDEARAEASLARSLAVAREQGALSWELRASMTVARLRAKQGRAEEGRQQLRAVYARFTEGFETVDLQAAKQLLQTSA